MSFHVRFRSATAYGSRKPSNRFTLCAGLYFVVDRARDKFVVVRHTWHAKF